MYTIGTAGHVDHGKSTLVRALTGIDPDRWEEEKRREMTIDLGFAWLTLPGGQSVSIIDVPGHERFIKNMLAGIGGIDAALLVVAADESVMPQTIEHLAILDLLDIKHGLVVLTRCDLVDDPWLELVYDDLHTHLAGTTLAGAPRVAVSARTGQGIDSLLTTLETVLDALPPRTSDEHLPRLPVDRAFSVSGFGTVVTGTLLGGALHVGQEVALLPHNLRARVRGLQSHQQRMEQAHPGSRVAVNLSGIHHDQVTRGDLLTLPGALEPTQVLDVQLRLTPTAPHALQHNAALDLFLGAAEVRCRAALLDCEELEPGATGWAQLRLAQPVAAVRGERCILRQPSPSITMGGGTIVDTHPPRHRRFRPDVIATLETLARGTPDALLLQALGDDPPLLWSALVRRSKLPEPLAQAGLTTLAQQERVVTLRPHADQEPLLVTVAGWQRLVQQLTTTLRSYHQRFPLRSGMPRQELRQRLRLEPPALLATLYEAAARTLLAFNETTVWLADHTPAPTPAQQQAIDRLLAAMEQQPYSPPSPDLEDDLLAWLVEQGSLVRVGVDVVFLPAAYETMIDWVRATIVSEGGVSVARFRDHFGTSRKYALALLEHLDERRITRRSGDVRVLV